MPPRSKPTTPLALAYSLLSRRNYSSAELKNRLLSRFPESSSTITKIIQDFQNKKYLDDELYAKNLILSRLRLKPCGLLSLRHYLLTKKIPPHLINPLLKDLDEIPHAKRALTTKQKTLPPNLTPQQTKTKLIRFLTSRGFSSQTIHTTLNL